MLFATSWGSVPGIRMAAELPDLFSAYVGHSQVVNFRANFKLSYEKVLAISKQNNDTLSMQLLREIGHPPYESAKKYGKLLRVVKKYERPNSVAFPTGAIVAAAAYSNEADEQHRSDGDDYSFVHFAGDTRLGVSGMMEEVNAQRNYTSFSIPVYFIQGEEDILTPKEFSQAYLNILSAPVKEFILLKKTAHGFNDAVMDAKLKIFKRLSK